MSEQLRLERNLPGVLEDLYLAGTPDYRNDVLAAVARTRQRPAWTFVERWIPVVDIAIRPALAGRLPTRALMLALLVLAFVAAGLLFYIGSQQRELPAPFGPARNGGVVYALGGDLYLGDPATGASRAIVTGAGHDRKPLMSPDGTHVAFLRTTEGSTADSFELFVSNVDGGELRAISTANVSDRDPLVWSPDGTFLLLTTGPGEVLRYDVEGGAPVVIAHSAQVLQGAFQPPAGLQVLYETDAGGGLSLGLMNPDGTGARTIYAVSGYENQDGCGFGSAAWSPDGSRIAFLRRPEGDPSQCRIFVINADGTGEQQLTTEPGEWTETDFLWSPDGTQIAFDRWHDAEANGDWQIQPIGVVSASGGSVRSVGPTPVPDGGAFVWSPDGRSIISVAATVTGWPPSTTMSQDHPMIIDVATGEATEATWSISSWPSWQRLAP